MKKTKRLLSFVLAFVMLASCAAFPAQADEAVPEYEIDFVYDVNEATATALISISGGEYSVGRFGFSYNTDALTLITDDGSAFDAAYDFVDDAVIGLTDGSTYTVYTTEETNAVADLIDTENGIVLFAWYTADNEYVDATNEAKPLAEVKFVLSDALLAEANPTVAFSEVEEAILPLGNDAIDADLLGWDNVYVVANSAKEKLVSNETNVAVSDTVITVDISDVEVKATVNTNDRTKINLSWASADKEIGTNIAKYRVYIFKKNGDAVTDGSGNPVYVEKNAGDRDENGKYVVALTSANGIQLNNTYKFVVTPVTTSGNVGIPTSVSVNNSNISSGVAGGSVPSGGNVSDIYANTIKVTFDAAGGIIPEGQQYIYNVAQGSYISTTPIVIAPAGKVFAGWSVDGVTLVSVPVYKITKAVAFKALYADAEDEIHRTFIVGYPDGEVKATLSLTRAEAAAIIARASEDFDEAKVYSASFSDVAADSWYYNYVAYVYEKGIVTGYENGTFAPDNKITRAEFATIMQRYLGLAGNENAAFTDVAGHWAASAIGACKDAGLINGYENGEFRPDVQITRAEAVTILNRASDREPTASAIDAYVAEKGIPFSDISTSDWYYYEIMEAAFPHLVTYFH